MTDEEKTTSETPGEAVFSFDPAEKMFRRYFAYSHLEGRGKDFEWYSTLMKFRPKTPSRSATLPITKN